MIIPIGASAVPILNPSTAEGLDIKMAKRAATACHGSSELWQGSFSTRAA